MTAETSTLTSLNNRPLALNTEVILHPLRVTQDGDQYIVGRMNTGEFIALQEIGGQIIQYFQRGYNLGEAQEMIAENHQVEVDMDDFVDALIDLKFVKAINGEVLADEDIPEANLSWITPEHVKWLFSTPAKLAYLLILLFTGITLAAHPQPWPSYTDYFWSSSTSITLFVNTLILFVTAMLHEVAHLVAARSLGAPARIGFGTRLHNLVIETDVTGIWAVSRKYRYRVYLAGIFWDILLSCFSLLMLVHFEFPHTVQMLLRALILTKFLGIAGQFFVFMRTDMYFVLLDLFHCFNLFEDAVNYLKYIAKQKFTLFHKPRENNQNPLLLLPNHERGKVQIYAVFMLIGSFLSLLVFFTYALPISIELIIRGIALINLGLEQRIPLRIVDGGLTILIESGFYIAFVIVFIKKRRPVK
ncbi:MAG: hypothetical protein OEZ02_08640 [Anaerolineae bacterium]|nr:hypothetical protein [Anaerolineae bacterium]